MRSLTRHTSRRPVVCLLAFGLLAASCGDDTDSTEPIGGTADAAAGDDAPAADDGNAPSETGDDTADGGTGTAVVTLATGEAFEFDQELVCIALGGAVSGSFRNDEGVEVSIDVPPEDWETSTTGDWEGPSLTLRDERDEMNWRIFEAGPSLAGLYLSTEVDKARITAFSVDGAHATGNGFVIDTFGVTRAGAEGSEPPTAVPVTFGFECS